MSFSAPRQTNSGVTCAAPTPRAGRGIAAAQACAWWHATATATRQQSKKEKSGRRRLHAFFIRKRRLLMRANVRDGMHGAWQHRARHAHRRERAVVVPHVRRQRRFHISCLHTPAKKTGKRVRKTIASRRGDNGRTGAACPRAGQRSLAADKAARRQRALAASSSRVWAAQQTTRGGSRHRQENASAHAVWHIAGRLCTPPGLVTAHGTIRCTFFGIPAAILQLYISARLWC